MITVISLRQQSFTKNVLEKHRKHRKNVFKISYLCVYTEHQSPPDTSPPDCFHHYSHLVLHKFPQSDILFPLKYSQSNVCFPESFVICTRSCFSEQNTRVSMYLVQLVVWTGLTHLIFSCCSPTTFCCICLSHSLAQHT